jgi:hypothetical protein
MWVLESKEMESSSKIDLRDVINVHQRCRLEALVTTKLSKEGFISLPT